MRKSALDWGEQEVVVSVSIQIIMNKSVRGSCFRTFLLLSEQKTRIHDFSMLKSDISKPIFAPTLDKKVEAELELENICLQIENFFLQ